MVKKRKIEKRPPRRKKEWTLKDVLTDLKRAGAREITDEMMEREPYKTFLKDNLRGRETITQ